MKSYMEFSASEVLGAIALNALRAGIAWNPIFQFNRDSSCNIFVPWTPI